MHSLYHPHQRPVSYPGTQRHSHHPDRLTVRGRLHRPHIRCHRHLPLCLLQHYRQLLLWRSQHPFHHVQHPSDDRLSRLFGRPDGHLRRSSQLRAGVEHRRFLHGLPHRLQPCRYRPPRALCLPSARRLSQPETSRHQGANLPSQPDTRTGERAGVLAVTTTHRNKNERE